MKRFSEYLEVGTNKIAKTYKKDTPGQSEGNKAQLGIPANATLAQLDKIRSDKSKSKATRTRAHWLANMRRGGKKK